MRKHSSIDQLSTVTRRQAQAEMAIMQSDLRKLRDRITNIDALGRLPGIRSKRTKTKKTKQPSILEQLGLTASASSSLSMTTSYTENQTIGDYDNGYSSQSQEAARVTEKYSYGLRLR